MNTISYTLAYEKSEWIIKHSTNVCGLGVYLCQTNINKMQLISVQDVVT